MSRPHAPMALLRLTSRILIVVPFVLFAACGSEPAGPVPAATGGGVPVDPATTGTLSGKVSFSGVPSAPEMLQMGTDPACVVGGVAERPSDAVLVDDAGGVQNAFVYIKDGLDPKYSFPVPQTAVEIDQSGCLYKPRVLGVQLGQALEIVNDDDTLHNVHALPVDNVEFNEGQPIKGLRLTHLFTKPEVMVRFKCNVHSWMTAWVGVVAHPYFAVTSADGSFSIQGVPPGTYTVEAWHETFGRLTEQVTVAERQQATASFTFSEK